MSAHEVVDSTLNLCVYDFVSQEICTVKDPKFGTFLHQKYSLKRGYLCLDGGS